MSSLDTSVQGETIQRMRADWNRRAQEDARFYIAFGRRKQDDVEFAATASEVLDRITSEFTRLPPHMPTRARRFLEIGCGIGRLMAPLSQFCGEIHGVDIADEMIRMGRERLADIEHAHLHWTRDSDLAVFADDSFDLVYSFAVMQHLPNEAPFWRYLAESARVLRDSGVLLQQFNSLAEDRDAPNTWAGIVVPVDRVLAACADLGMQVLALEGAGTQYTWLTATPRQVRAPDHPLAPLFETRQVTGADAAKRVTAGGPSGFAEIYVAQLAPEYCDLCRLAGQIADVPIDVVRSSSLQADGLRQIVLRVPDHVPKGRQDIHLTWNGALLTHPFSVDVEPFRRGAARVLAVTDGVDLLSREKIVSGVAKVWINNLSEPALFRARIGEVSIRQMDFHCEDRVDQRYQVNLRLPASIPRGRHRLEVAVGDVVILCCEIVNGMGEGGAVFVS
jgi:SAM-dependent methyltransferase